MFRRRIVDHQYYQSYAHYFRLDNFHLGPSPPAPYHMQNHPYPILGTSLVNGLRPTHASLFRHLGLRLRTEQIPYDSIYFTTCIFISPYACFILPCSSLYLIFLFHVLVAILQIFMFQLLLFKHPVLVLS